METEKSETTYTIRVDAETWENFKKTVTKDKTLNEAIVDLIKERITNAK